MRPGRLTTPRAYAAVVLLGLALFPPLAAADPTTPPPDPFPTTFPQPAPVSESHARAHIAFAAGAALTITSFVLSSAADRDYAHYQGDSDPVAIARDYDAAHTNDRWSAGTLLAGTGLLALGVYWRFIHRPASTSRVGVVPSLSPDHAGLALRVALR
jgi:hypothetical protein